MGTPILEPTHPDATREGLITLAKDIPGAWSGRGGGGAVPADAPLASTGVPASLSVGPESAEADLASCAV